MRDTIEEMDVKIEPKDNKVDFLKNKKGLPDSKVIEEMNRSGLNKTSSKEKVIGLLIDWIFHSTIISRLKTKKQKAIKLKFSLWCLIMTWL